MSAASPQAGASSSSPAEDGLPGISVIVITLNEEEDIRGCLDSLVGLDYPPDLLEIVVVDASTDATPRIVAGYPRVKLVRCEKGFSRQKNAGLAVIAHDLVAFTDADCIVDPGWANVISRRMKDAKVTGVGGNAFPPPDTGFFGRCVAAVGHPAGGSLGFDANIEPSPDGIDFIAGCNGAFRTRAIAGIGGFSSRFERGGEDVDLSWRLREAGKLLLFAEEMSLFHKPRNTFREYAAWNVRVGFSKYALRGTPVWRLLLEPSFPLWSVLIALGMLWAAVVSPGAVLLTLPLVWLAFLLFIYAGSKPYRLCFRRRDRVGLPLIALLTVVPFLIYVRQVGINIGQWREFSRA